MLSRLHKHLMSLARLCADFCFGRQRLHHQQPLHTDGILPRCAALHV